MDNLKYYNDSLAYDFEMFMPKSNAVPSRKDNIVVMPKVASRKSRVAANRKVSTYTSMLMCAIFVMAAFCGNIALRLKINEVNDEINSVKSAIAEIDSERVSLEVEMQRRISYANLELEAIKLGMQKPDKEHVTYIKINDKNVAVTAQGTFESEE